MHIDRPTLASAASLLLCTLFLFWSPAVQATPFYALNSANTCDTCHVEPIDWANPDTVWDRECTLDCQGCHISPTGGGMRTSMGKYYAAQALAAWGKRPADYGMNPPVPEDERARFNALFFDKESGEYRGGWLGGWQAGEMPHDEDKKRYGFYEPDPVFDVGADLRLLAIVPTEKDSERDIVAFPMQAQVYMAARFLKVLTAYLDVGWQGSQSGLTGTGDPSTKDLLQQKLWVREAFVMASDLPGMSYLRAGRFSVPYGWRVPDHTAYIRKGLWDQYSQGYGVEAGFAPNFPTGIYPWANVAAYRQGIEGWPGEPASTNPAWGVNAQGGVKQLGFTLGLSMSGLWLSEQTQQEFMTGPMWGVNLHPNVAYLGELDYKRVVRGELVVQSLYTYQEVHWMGWRGWTPKLRYEGLDPNFVIEDDHLHRALVGLDVMPHRFLKFEFAGRHQWAFDRPNSSELLLQLHALF